ncbi:MAG: universal stress protein [Myxococcales bacterium]|nr:universal stress protein [Myxococcales bacterium]
MNKIVAAVDFSAATDRVLRSAIGYAKAFGVPLEIVHVVFVPRDVVGGGMLYLDEDKIRADLERHAKSELAACVEKTKGEGVAVTSQILSGHPELEIPRHCESTKAGLLVLATHGRTGLAHLLIGSVAEKVVRASKVPVLVVPAEPAKGK